MTTVLTNPFDEYKDTNKKTAAFVRDSMAGVMAIDADANRTPLKNYNVCDVAFVSGLWRIQRPLQHPITAVRDREFVLLNWLERHENNMFEYWNALNVGNNCYGKFVIPKTTVVVARYKTDTGIYWGYGDTIEQARAFLGIRLFDEYSDLIHSVACRGQLVK